MNRITQFSRSPQGRGLMGKVQERLSGGGSSKTRGRRPTGRRPVGRRPAGRSGRPGRRAR